MVGERRAHVQMQGKEEKGLKNQDSVGSLEKGPVLQREPGLSQATALHSREPRLVCRLGEWCPRALDFELCRALNSSRWHTCLCSDGGQKGVLRHQDWELGWFKARV